MNYTKNGRSKADKGDYKVGYAKPPRHSRFTGGRSGNPKGRPAGTRNFKTDVKATLKAPVKLTRDGKPRKVSTQEAMLLRLREKALSGDSRALDRLILLAQAYNDEELIASGGLSADDADLLEIFKARVLSGAVATADSAAENDQTFRGPLSGRTLDVTGGHKAAPIKRLRLKNAGALDEPNTDDVAEGK